MDSPNTLSNITSWAEQNLQPLLADLGRTDLKEEAWEHLKHLEVLARRCGEVQTVCLLGQAGVGKSTLLNTLIADDQIVVPSGGGTGPLTANALAVEYGEHPSFSVRYHTRMKINRLRFVLDTALGQTPAPVSVAETLNGTTVAAPNSSHNPAFIKKQRQRLLDLRDEFVEAMAGMTRDTIRNAPEGSAASESGQHEEDAGNDAYDRDFALSVLAKEQDALCEIEQALRRIQMSSYGVCQISGRKIPQARLEAIPFARLTVECQAQWEKEHGKRRFRPSHETGPADGVVAAPEAEAGADDSSGIPEDVELDSEEDKGKRQTEAIRSAKLLVAGSQTAERELPYLSDALRMILGGKLKYGSEIAGEDLERLHRIQEALKIASVGEPKQFDGKQDDFKFRLREHACGFLAPLIAEMKIMWPSPMLAEGVQIIDLPGIGIVSDVYAKITAAYLRDLAKGVMLVVDSRGLRRDDAEVLRNSGFLNRLLHTVDDPASDPVALMIVVVKIDDVAEENWRNDKEMNGTALKAKAQHFSEVVETCSKDIRVQLNQFVRDIWANVDGTLSPEKDQVVRSLMETVGVFPVSAPQYRLHISKDPDENRPFITDPDGTMIPALRESIVKVAKDHKLTTQAHFEEGTRRFFGYITPRLEILAAERESNDVSPQVEEMREELELFVAPLRLELANRKGAFRNYLRKTVPGQIADKTDVAAAKAEREINAYLRTLSDAHWSTLRAAVRREGTFYGSRHINLPHDFALRFEEPLAEVWAKGILQGLRKATSEFADFQEQIVTEILAWARSRGMRVPKLLDALLMSVQENKKTLNSAGREAVDELRARVRQDLIKKIESPIRRRCKKFVEDQDDVGRGVKSRILYLFGELAMNVIEAATEPAKELLRERCKEAEKDILKALKEHSDPIEEACDALLERHERKLQRDAKNAVPAEAIREVIASLEAQFPSEPLMMSA